MDKKTNSKIEGVIYMKKYLLMFCVALCFAGCAALTIGTRPKWVDFEPEPTYEDLFFVGMSSEKVATEKDARDEAGKDATANVVRYIGRFFKEELTTKIARFGLSSNIVDPTKAAMGFEKHLSGALARRIKPVEWYREKGQSPAREDYFKVCVLVKVPKLSINEAYQSACDNEIENLKKQRDTATEEQAKKQIENAIDMFQKMKDVNIESFKEPVDQATKEVQK